MKMKLWLLFACLFLFPLAAKAKTVLPDSCGDSKIHFEVKTEKDQPLPAGPADGKAQLILAEDEIQRLSIHAQTVRYGIDGAWVGANYGNSYFAITVEPGEHHLCATWDGAGMHGLDMATITAEAGKTYYFTAQIGGTGDGTANVKVSGGPFSGGSRIAFNLLKLDEEQGKYRIKAGKLAMSKPKK